MPAIVNSLNERIHAARTFYNFVNQKVVHDPQSASDFNEAIAVYFYRSMTYMWYLNPTKAHETVLGDNQTYIGSQTIKNVVKRVSGKNYERLLADYLLHLIESNVPEANASQALDLGTIRVHIEAKKIFRMNTNELIVKMYEAYIRLQHEFSEKHRLEMINIAKEMLKNNYTELKVDDFERMLDSIIIKQDISIDKEENIHFPLHAFNNELERHATTLYGFSTGSFTYSKAYLSVMQAIFPSIRNPFLNKSRVLATKEEL